MAIEIVDFPIKHGDFPLLPGMLVHQRVSGKVVIGQFVNGVPFRQSVQLPPTTHKLPATAVAFMAP